jgi:hypothetical protein
MNEDSFKNYLLFIKGLLLIGYYAIKQKNLTLLWDDKKYLVFK